VAASPDAARSPRLAGLQRWNAGIQQRRRSLSCSRGSRSQAGGAILVRLHAWTFAMGLMHCPLCMGLAVLCAVRFSAHAWLVWRRFGPVPASASDAPLALA
jgi:hypothetical protein